MTRASRGTGEDPGKALGYTGGFAGSAEQAITADGLVRTFHLYRPAGLAGAAPLVVVLHGGFGSGAQAERSYRCDAEADRGRFLVAYPDGLGRAWNAGGGCCGVPARTGVRDTAFIAQMVATIEHEIPVDRARIYATGHGGPGDGAGHIDGPAVPALNATWRGIDHCAAPAVTTAGVVTTSVASCPGGRTVKLITVAGAGHQWPGSVPRPFMQRCCTWTHRRPHSTPPASSGASSPPTIGSTSGLSGE